MSTTNSDTYVSGLIGRRDYLDIYFGQTRVRTGSYIVTQSLRTPCPDHTDSEAVRQWLEKIEHPELLLHQTATYVVGYVATIRKTQMLQLVT